ncbi:hypothetical protein LGH70_07935 [Hymenobacter sp. BT635]|uniref:Uncharacterized protein n=1 Tax=Hymenobacter nitidus TaxID=2880929 RepID=A0ABS8AAU0_9BACT|nr:hypothetical protein [Hymenobacter nitidus]MCB2377507.1 hypothetical protein [Hymenobacter nitidus]
MAEYVLKSTDARTFTLAANDALLGELKYPEWYSYKALLALPDGTALRVEPRGFWGTTIELKDEQDAVLLSFKMHWNGSIILKSSLGGVNRAFVLKGKDLLEREYVLLDRQGQELLTIRPKINWSKVNYDYTVVSSEAFEALEQQAILVLMAIHCTNHYISTSSALLATAVAVSI